MIRLKGEPYVIKDTYSLQDLRRKVDIHVTEYLCPPDLLHETEHVWRVYFEVKRGRSFEPPSAFPDKSAAVQFLRERR